MTVAARSTAEKKACPSNVLTIRSAGFFVFVVFVVILDLWSGLLWVWRTFPSPTPRRVRTPRD